MGGSPARRARAVGSGGGAAPAVGSVGGCFCPFFYGCFLCLALEKAYGYELHDGDWIMGDRL